MAEPGRASDVEDEEILAILRDAEDPVLTTAEIAAQIDIGQRGTYDRLKRLNDEGQIQRKKVGARAVVWWINSS